VNNNFFEQITETLYFGILLIEALPSDHPR